MGTYTLRDLAKAVGRKERTVRYYRQLGLLRQPGQIGPGAHYEEDDRLRLLLIGQLQAQGRSLTDITEHFANLDELGIRGEALAHGSALDYVRSVLGKGPTLSEPLASTVATPSMSSPPTAEPSRWERIEIVPGIELHVRQPVSPERRRFIAAYTARARKELEGNRG